MGVHATPNSYVQSKNTAFTSMSCASVWRENAQLRTSRKYDQEAPCMCYEIFEAGSCQVFGDTHAAVSG